MKILVKGALAAVLIMTMTAFTVFASGPVQKRVNFTIDVPFLVETGNDLLAPGDYVLYQISQNSPNLFALYQEDMTNEPVAMIHTARVVYQSGEYPEETEIMLGKDDESECHNDYLRPTGWMIPGMDGWEVISVVD
jgi:hypothetical protein